MSAQDNATKLGVPNKNLVFETAGRIYVKVQDRFYELDFRNQGKAGDTKIEIINNSTSSQEIDMKGYVTKEFLKASLNSYVTKRSWNDVKETQSMLENAMLDGFTESINPITIQTMQVVVGSDQLQFEFVNDFTHAEEIAYGPNVYKNSIEFNDPGNGIYIKHYTLDGPTEVRPEDIENSEQLKMQYCRWRIAPNRFDLGDPSASYYIYIKVPRLQDNGSWINSSNPITIYTKTNAEGTSVYNQFGLGEFVLSNTAIEMASESDYYYLLYGMINSDDGNGRSFSTMNGFTEILPGQITAYIFKSASGDSYLDLRKNELKLGDAFQWNINNNNILYIKGAIVVDDGGNESYMYLDRGIFHRYRYPNNGGWAEADRCDADVNIQGNVYYKGNTVVWTNDKGITSTYMYIGPNSNPDASGDDTSIHAYNTCDDPVATGDENYDPTKTYFDPTNENFWRVLAKGVRGYSNLIADLSNEMEAIACDKDGYVINEDGLTVTTQASLYYGSSEVELHSTESGSTITFDGIIIDTHEIDDLNPQPEDPEAPRNPELTYRILDTEPVSYSKIIEFTIPHGLKLPEKGEISITMKSKNQYGEEDNDTRSIVFTLVGVRSGKAYSLVPSARSVKRAANGLYDPSSFECGVVCNGTSENVDPNEVIVKRVFGDTLKIFENTENEYTIDITEINQYFNDFINDTNLNWDWYTDGSAIDTTDSITFGNETDFEKITLFLYYQDPLSFKWMLCDKETILIVKDGDPGKDFSITASSNVFMYETESSKIPTNSVITLKGVPKNIKTVDHYIWQYRIPDVHQDWNYIDPPSALSFNDPTNKPHWWKSDVDDEMSRSTLVINGPIIDNNDVDLQDFNTYFYNNTTTEHRMCEFQVTIYYTELGATTSLSDSTSLHIIKGGDGSLTVYLPNSAMNFASTDKKGVSLNLAERTEVVAYYGLEKLISSGQNRNRINDVTITRYQYTDTDGVVHIYDSDPGHSPISNYTRDNPNAVTASYDAKKCSITVSTGTNDNAASFMANSGEIDVAITIHLTDKDPETHVITRTIYWNTAKQGEIGIAKQPRGRSDFNSSGYCGTECYQGTQDTKDTWDGTLATPPQPWDPEKNIFFDIVRIPGTTHDLDQTYYCVKGGPSAAANKPGVGTNWTTHWKLMTYANIAASVAWIDKGLIEELTVKKLKTKGDNYVTDIVKIEDNWINVIDNNQNSIINLSTNALPPSDNISDKTISFNGINTTISETTHSASTNLVTISGLNTSRSNITTIPAFKINCDVHYDHSGDGSGDSLITRGVKFEVWLSTQSGSNTGYCIDSYQEGEAQNSYIINIPSYVIQLDPTVTWYLNLIWSYSLPSCTDFKLKINSFTITVKYPSSSKDGTIIGGNGFQTKWGNNSINVNNSQSNHLEIRSDQCNIDVSGTTTLGGTARVTRVISNNTNSYDIVGSNQIKAIFVQQGNSSTSLTTDGLYFLYD